MRVHDTELAQIEQNEIRMKIQNTINKIEKKIKEKYRKKKKKRDIFKPKPLT